MKTLFDSVNALESSLTFHRERQAVLAGNVANIDTPGFRPLDLERVDPQTAPAALAGTDPAHLQASDVAGATLSFADGGNAGADGNAVSLERELAKMDANRVRYHTGAELVTRHFALLRYTADDGK